MRCLFAVCSVLLFLLTLPLQSSAQRPDDRSHGPRAGRVVGSGALRAEVVWWGKPEVTIYFLTDQWVDVEDGESSAKVVYSSPKNPKGSELTCKVGKPAISCALPSADSIHAGDKLTITRLKAGTPPKDFEYVFPDRDSSAGH